jgi:hypothetical protein
VDEATKELYLSAGLFKIACKEQYQQYISGKMSDIQIFNAAKLAFSKETQEKGFWHCLPECFVSQE